jgi:nitrate reductase NapAB chaperone NapD
VKTIRTMRAHNTLVSSFVIAQAGEGLPTLKATRVDEEHVEVSISGPSGITMTVVVKAELAAHFGEELANISKPEAP